MRFMIAVFFSLIGLMIYAAISEGREMRKARVTCEETGGVHMGGNLCITPAQALQLITIRLQNQ